MTQMWLLLVLLALADQVTCDQIIYPDQYEMMMKLTSTIPPYSTYAYIGNSGRAESLPAAAYPVSSINQAAPIDQQFNRESPSFSLAAAPVRPSYPTTTPAFFSSMRPTASQEPDWGSHVNNIIAKGILKFSLDLDRAIYKTSVTSNRDNVVFSPLSVSVALSLVLLGSAGRTFDEVSRVLGLEAGVDISQHSEVVHQMFGLLLSFVNYRVDGSNGPRVNSASGIFVQEGYPIRPEFRAISENAYKSEVMSVDFKRRGIEARDTINNWVKERTMEKITSILNEVPNPLTNVILLSALYFNGEWNQHFLNSQTRKKQFFIEPNDVINVDMMYNGGNFPFYEDKSLKIVALPYKGLEMSMYVLLPSAEGATALKSFRDGLTAEIIENLISNLRNQTCIIGLPRMKLSSTLTLNNALQSLGLHSLFNPSSADLSLLSNGYGQDPVTMAIPSMTQRTTSPWPIPQGLPQPLPQVSQQLPNQRSTDDYLIFSRVSENNGSRSNGTRRNYFRYDDTRRGVSVEQWDTGFQIHQIRRTRRSIAGRDVNDAASSRTMYATENVANAPKVGDENTRYVSLEENKYRFRDASKKDGGNRRRRQSRPMDESFLRFIQSKNFPSFGLDALRNSASLTNPGLFADEVLHKVEMDVTERGTEAAATTGIILDRTGNQKRLVADRPFLFFIRHDPTKLVLFWGTVNAPTPNYAVVR
ncbi:leukocyte elastase inhibitor B isoform X2 [Ooceraea biroi]|nr:leukocyte elastase inhibitor B isoform X2 [Ooceraea biroi]